MTTLKIDKHDARLNSVKFLASAMDLKDIRFHVTHFKVENNQGISTDGHRLHVVNDIPLEDGFYAVHKAIKSSALIEKTHELDTRDGNFPEVGDLLTVPDAEYHHASFEPDTLSSAYTQVVRAMVGNNTLNVNFIKDICNCFDGIANFIVPEPRDGETDKPVHFVLNGYHAVVMPIRI